jgi:thiol-disulfide isomerase/thioredoxin
MPMRVCAFIVVVLTACSSVLVPVQSFQPSLPPMSRLRQIFNQEHISSSSSSSFHMPRRYYFSAAMDRPLSSSDAPPVASAANFEEHMRQLVQNTNKQSQRKASSLQLQSPPEAPHVIQVSTLQEYKHVVVGDATTTAAAPDQITVVRFYAIWCRACHAIQAPFYRLGRTGDTTTTTPTASKYQNVKFVQVAVGPENAALHQYLGVPSLPYGHIYHATGGLIEELRLNRKRFGDFEKILQSYNNGECLLALEVDPVSGVYEAPYERS